MQFSEMQRKKCSKLQVSFQGSVYRDKLILATRCRRVSEVIKAHLDVRYTREPLIGRPSPVTCLWTSGSVNGPASPLSFLPIHCLYNCTCMYSTIYIIYLLVH